MTKPTDIRTPNAQTIEALQQARDQERLSEYAGLEDLKAAINEPCTRLPRPDSERVQR